MYQSLNLFWKLTLSAGDVFNATRNQVAWTDYQSRKPRDVHLIFYFKKHYQKVLRGIMSCAGLDHFPTQMSSCAEKICALLTCEYALASKSRITILARVQVSPGVSQAVRSTAFP